MISREEIIFGALPTMSSAELRERAVASLCALVGAIRQRSQPAWLDVDLTMAQVKALAAICRAGRVHGRGLAHMLGVGQPAVSKLVDHLVDQGYVRREDDREDRRVVWLCPTEKGRALYDRVTVANQEAWRAVIDALQPEELDLVTRAWDVLVRATERLAAEQRPLTPPDSTRGA
jgi:DNA-binding MarR family transcriptional regulator